MPTVRFDYKVKHQNDFSFSQIFIERYRQRVKSVTLNPIPISFDEIWTLIETKLTFVINRSNHHLRFVVAYALVALGTVEFAADLVVVFGVDVDVA